MGLLDGLLDQNLSEIDDLPTYEVPPNGFYRLLVKSVEEKTVNTKNGEEAILDIKYIVKEALELSDPTQADQVKENQEFNESYFFRNNAEMTTSALKTTFAEVALHFGYKKLSETLGNLKGLELFATVKRRIDSKDPENVKTYAQVKGAKVA